MSKTSRNFQDFIGKLAKVVADNQAGLALINREFDSVCEEIDRSIANIRVESARCTGRSQTELSQERKLRKQSEEIERDILKSESQIAKFERGIRAVDGAIRSLHQEKASLEQQIQNRWLIEKVYFCFAQDEAEERRATLQCNLDNREKEKAALEQTKWEFESARLRTESRRDNLTRTLDGIRQKLAAIKKLVQCASEQERKLSEKRTGAENKRTQRKNNLLECLASAWEKASAETAQQMAGIRKPQPAFADWRQDNPNMASGMPDILLLGSQEVSFKQFGCMLPHGISFPFEHALTLPEDNAAQLRLAHHLLLRLFQAVPPGRLELTLIDPLKLGHSFAPFLPLLEVETLLPQQRVLTRADEIEFTLGKLTDDTEELIQRRFKGNLLNWSDYNAAHPNNLLPYKIVLLFDAPEQLSEKSLWYLGRLTENGPRCGILPIIAVDSQRLEDRKYETFRASLERSTRRLDALLNVADHIEDGLSFSYQPEGWPAPEVLETFLLDLAGRYRSVARFSKTLKDLWTGYAKDATTIGGFNLPIGWTPSGETVSLILGAVSSEHHALLAGKTGTGKSNLLHVIIHSMCEKYSPQEVDLYLLDYKESTEFTVYANPPLPHARLIATESDCDYGVTVLQHLVDELENRARLFKAEGINDFAEYRMTKRSQLPRILLVIDEFQVLFGEGRQVAETAEKLLAQLLKQGRSFGIHVLLATQTLKGISALSLGSLISQLGCRIALACGQEDSAMILGSNNLAAAELKSPPEGIINNANGAKSANVRFLIPLAEKSFCRDQLRRISERTTKRGVPDKARIFNGANLPQRPGLGNFQAICRQSNVLLLGERLTFTADALSVPLVSRQAFNVLFSGYNDLIHDGLLSATLSSLAFAGDFDEIIYFNGRGIAPCKGFADVTSTFGVRFKAFNDVAAVPLQEISDQIGKRRIALIIDGLDAEKALHPVQTFKTPKPGEPVTPSELLKRIAEEGSRKGTFIFAFLDNWRRCAVPCRDLFNQFELRVAFCMNEDDAGTLVSGGIGKFKGIDGPNRAVFVDRMKNEIHWFRPYVATTGASL